MLDVDLAHKETFLKFVAYGILGFFLGPDRLWGAQQSRKSPDQGLNNPKTAGKSPFFTRSRWNVFDFLIIGVCFGQRCHCIPVPRSMTEAAGEVIYTASSASLRPTVGPSRHGNASKEEKIFKSSFSRAKRFEKL